MRKFGEFKIIILLILGFLFAFLPLFATNLNLKNSDFSDIISIDNENLKTSALSAPIYINDNNPSANWSVAEGLGLCTGSGNYTHPYVIEDLVIDGGGSGSCILIENSNVYFRIENCTLYNAGIFGAGIELYRVDNGQLVENNCSFNRRGIHLTDGNNHTISGNTVNNNTREGIYLTVSIYSSVNNTISGNTANNNPSGIHLSSSNYNNITGNFVNNNNIGIWVEDCYKINVLGNIMNNNDLGIMLSDANHTISGNIMNGCGLGVSSASSIEELCSYNIDTTNLVNGKLLYYKCDETYLGSSDFMNAGQIILINCTNSIISNLDFSFCSNGIAIYYCSAITIQGNNGANQITGIMLFYSHNNTVSENIESSNEYYGIYIAGGDNNTVIGNTANYNNDYGIYLSNSNNNTLSGNIANSNGYDGIHLYHSDYNTISGNTANSNDEIGIRLDESNNNTVTQNMIKGNNGGLWIEAIPGFFDSSENSIFLNCFIDNKGNAYDEGTNNYWDNGIKGNYWDDYNNTDTDGDGIGDVPYTIFGPAGSQDRFPLMTCPISASQGFPIELIILISVISGGAVIGVAAFLLIRRKRKRIE